MDIIKSLEQLEQASDALRSMSIPEKYRDKYEELMRSIDMIKAMPSSSSETMMSAMIGACNQIIVDITDGIKNDMEEQLNKIRGLSGMGGSSRRPSTPPQFPGNTTPVRSTGESSGFRGTVRSG